MTSEQLLDVLELASEKVEEVVRCESYRSDGYKISLCRKAIQSVLPVLTGLASLVTQAAQPVVPAAPAPREKLFPEDIPAAIANAQLMMVTHDHDGDCHPSVLFVIPRTNMSFPFAFQRTLDGIKEDNPDNWDDNMVYSSLRRQGWVFIALATGSLNETVYS